MKPKPPMKVRSEQTTFCGIQGGFWTLWSMANFRGRSGKGLWFVFKVFEFRPLHFCMCGNFVQGECAKVGKQAQRSSLRQACGIRMLGRNLILASWSQRKTANSRHLLCKPVRLSVKARTTSFKPTWNPRKARKWLNSFAS